MADLIARIAGLWRYPVKSCAGEAMDILRLDAEGWPEGDRGWGIMDAAGELSWMGAHPRLALVAARLHGNDLELKAAGQTLVVAGEGGHAVELRAWNGDRQAFDRLQAWDAGDAAAALLRAVAGAPLRLVRLSAAAQRRPGLNTLHLVGEGSLQAWSDASPAPLQHAAERARPNLLLTAEPGQALTPFIEDLLTEARLDRGLVLRRTQPCIRCVVPTVDPASGDAQPAVLDTLVRLSAERAPGAPVQFGVYLRASGAGLLRVGDRVEVDLDFG
jgi:uncharacterized protein YcbX